MAPQKNLYLSGINILLGLLALTSIAGGTVLLLKPDGSLLGFPQGLLAGSPFDNYLLPGLFIVGVFGLGSLLTMIGFHIGKFWAWFTTAMLSAALIGFEIIERLIIGQSFLQYIFGAIGIALIILVFFGETKAAQQNSKF